MEEKPKILLTVAEPDGNVIRRVEGSTTKGFHRVTWDFRYPSAYTIDIHSTRSGRSSSGLLAPPGNYTATLAK